MQNILYQYRDKWDCQATPARYIICGKKSFITKYIKKKEFADLFGGHVIWIVKNDKRFISYHFSIGIYGKRNIGRFKRILKERGAYFNIINAPETKSHRFFITKDYRPILRKKGIIK